MDRRDLLGWIVVGAGLFSISGAVIDWDWFMNNRRAQLWLKLFGRQGTRIFYGVLGVVIAAIGSLMVSGVVASPK